jgi:hypothetical protein
VKLKRTEKPVFGRSPGEFLRHLAPAVGASSVNPLKKVLAAVKEVLPSKKATLVVICVGAFVAVAIFLLFWTCPRHCWAYLGILNDGPY